MLADFMSPPAAALVHVVLSLVVSASATAASIDAAQGPATPGALPASSSRDSYRIGAGDKLDIDVVGRPTLARPAMTVDSRGLIRMPYIKEPIVAGCLTVDELSEALERQYAPYLVEPQVTVSVREYSGQSVEVFGAVAKPGLFQLQREVRLRELLTIAGGVAPNASPLAQFVHDENSAACQTGAAGDVQFRHETTVTSVDLTKLLRGEGENPVVRPGDFVHIPLADQVFVVGQVTKPSALPLVGRLTVSRAVAMAGGRTANAKTQARIVRLNPDGAANTDLLVDLKAVEQEGALDIELRSGDVVEVPLAAGRQAFKFVLASLLTAGLYYPLILVR
jgi:polysaccharide biosynthesis/export protein